MVMSLFFISSDRDAARRVRDEIQEIYSCGADLYECASAYMAVSSVYRKQNTVKSFGGSLILIVGTIFNKQHFNQDVLDEYSDFDSLAADLKSDEPLFFGHYTAVCLDHAKNRIEIIPDRVGMINIYYTSGPTDKVYISNDLLFVSRLSGRTRLHAQTVREFIMTESNLNHETIFCDIYRMRPGRELVVESRQISDPPVFSYHIPHLSKEEYTDRVLEYFSYLNHFPGRIGIDLSAGYDTRTILALGRTCLGEFVGFSANRDDSIDAEISGIIADRYRIDCRRMTQPDPAAHTPEISLRILHSTSVLRNTDRSWRYHHLFEERFRSCDLSLGGFGGEFLRAKYNRWENLDDFIGEHYSGLQAERIFHFSDYTRIIRHKLQEYPVPDGMNPELLQNWYHAIAKTRVWGSAYIQTASLYGCVLHPLMDWYLMSPVLGFSLSELENAGLQQEIIDRFAPKLKDLPVNRRIGQEKPSVSERAKDFAYNHKLTKNAATIAFDRQKNRREKKNLQSVTFNAPETDGELNFSHILYDCGSTAHYRMRTVLSAYEYVTEQKAPLRYS